MRPEQSAFMPRFASQLRSSAPAFALFLSVGVAWELIVRTFNIATYLLPAPSAILTKMIEARAMLFQNLVSTMAASMAGFLIGTLLAILTAVVFLYSRTLERALFPWALIIKAVPILAIAPLLTIWLGFGLAPKIAISAIACYFPVLVNAAKGLRTVGRPAMEFLAIVGASKRQSFFHARWFAALPYIFAAAKISSSTAVIGAIVAEFTGANLGIGTVIVTAGYQQDTTMLFSAIVISSIATIILFYIVVLAEKLCLYWPEAQAED
ncbi:MULTISPECIES: ABC transporter permease [Sphingomonadales]|uniref:Putative aliphatic sulfonates transport permease protein SsuC n=1 Tax=Edaphosphingomonas haloaromaticamans TaxID=653954 RepID=A0A1S1H973_9SPHN|nr:ABC transporter permease [Sphingomonas haloaromaticamans]OHT18674.1 putative aliphatic sulfonates transport permease protein SsuC [Sphingomonas haloaromaticamans]